MNNLEKKTKKNLDQPQWRVFLVDDHPMLIEGLTKLVEQIPQCTICGQAASASEALEKIPSAMPDLVITDISLPDKNGLELIKDLNSMHPDLKILTFSMHDEMLYAARTLKAGARGYLMKGADTNLLEKAVNRVLKNGIYLSPQVADHLLRNMSGGSLPQSRLQVLSDRELEIFELIGRCRSISQISDQLNISPKTVDAHRGNIKAKLNLTDAASLMREAILWIELEKDSLSQS
jgi:DNA-binding NarL/FixJ family response regulator